MPLRRRCTPANSGAPLDALCPCLVGHCDYAALAVGHDARRWGLRGQGAEVAKGVVLDDHYRLVAQLRVQLHLNCIWSVAEEGVCDVGVDAQLWHDRRGGWNMVHNGVEQQVQRRCERSA